MYWVLSILKFTGAEKLSLKMDKTQYIMIEPNLFELAVGHKAVDSLGVIHIGFDDELTCKWTTAQYSSDAYEKVWNDGLNKEDLCQSFIARSTSLIGEKFYCGKIGALSETFDVYLHPDDGTGKPNLGITLDAGSFVVNTWTPGEFLWRIPGNLVQYSNLVVGTRYWIVISAKGTTTSLDLCFALKYLSSRDAFPDGKLMKYDGTTFTDVNYDSAFELLFETREGIEIKIGLTNGENDADFKYKNCKVTSNDCSVEGNALIFDSGTIEAENLEVEEKPKS